MQRLTTTAALCLLVVLLYAAQLGCDCGCDDDDDGGGSSPPPDDDTDDDDTVDDDFDDDTSGEAPITTADPPGGLYGDGVLVTLTSIDDVTDAPTIYFTTNGDDPVVGAPTTESGTSPVVLDAFTEHTVLKFFAVDENDLQEEPQEEEYFIDSQAPLTTADEPGGQYNVPVDVVLTSVDDTTAAPIVYYRTDGGDPEIDDPDTLFGESPVDLGTFSDNFTLKFFGVDDFGHVEDMRTDYYEFDLEAPNTTADPEGGVFGAPIDITLTSVDNDDPAPIIYYTVDGSTPAVGGPSTLFGATPVVLGDVGSSFSLRFFARDASGNEEFLKQEDYVFDFDAATCDSSPGEGVYNGPYPPLAIQPLNVELACPDDLDPAPTIYYTVDGTAPVIGGPNTLSAASPVTVELPYTTDVRFFSVDHVGNVSPEETRRYEILWWDDWELWLSGQSPGFPWYITSDPWSCTLPTISTITTVPGGQVLRMVDLNVACVEGDSYAATLFDTPLTWPANLGFQFSMRLRGGTSGGFGSYFTELDDQPWRTLVYFHNGVIQAWNQAVGGGTGGWQVCRNSVTIDQWYFIDIRTNPVSATYTVYIDGANSTCNNMAMYNNGTGMPGSMSGVKFVTDGPTDGIIEFNDFRIYDTTL